jgi:hypothetical protein
VEATRLRDDGIDAVAWARLTSVSEQPALLANLAHANAVAINALAGQNAVAHQQAMNQMGIAITGTTVHLLHAARGGRQSVTPVLTANVLALEIASLARAVRALVTK